MLISQIKLYQKGDVFCCKIKHRSEVVKSGWYKDAADAYREAQRKLIPGLGYVRPVPRSEYVT